MVGRVRIDHRRLDVRVTQVLVDLADVDTVEQKMRYEAMPECVSEIPLRTRRVDSTPKESGGDDSSDATRGN